MNLVTSNKKKKVGFINSLEPSKKTQNFHYFYYADFETLLYNNKHFVTCYSIKNATGSTCLTQCLSEITESNIEVKSDALIKDFILECFIRATTKTCTVFFHNLSRFDGFFLLHDYCKNKTDYLVNIKKRDNTIYSIEFIKQGIGKLTKKGSLSTSKVVFRDTYLLLPESLAIIAKNFSRINLPKNLLDTKKPFLKALYLEIGDEKTEFTFNQTFPDYSNPAFLQKLKLYCESDVKILTRAFILYCDIILDHFKINPISCLTLASLAFKIFRTHFYNLKSEFLISQSHGFTDAFIRSSYKGGVVDVYKPCLENGYFYDVNSLYPFIMKTFEMPVGKGVYLKTLNTTDFNITDFFGFIEVDVTCPEMYIPFLCVNSKDRGLISPTGKWTGIYFSEEIKYALTLGYTFQYKSAFKFEKHILFDKYVNALYKKRLEYKNSNPPLANIMKLLLNSLYGRFGMKNTLNHTVFLEKDDSTSFAKLNLCYSPYNYHMIHNKLVLTYDSIPNLKDIITLYKDGFLSKTLYYQLLKENDIKQQNLNISVQISSAITAYARIYMHKLKVEYKESLYYSDTDSLILSKPLAAQLVSSDILGLLKHEYHIKRGLFISPKFYYIITEKLEEIKKAKGLTGSLLTLSDYMKLYNEEPLTVNVQNSFLRNLNDYTIHSKAHTLTIQGEFKKRLKIYNISRTKWVDTLPLSLPYDPKEST